MEEIDTSIKDMDIRQVIIMSIFTSYYNNFIFPRWTRVAITRRWWSARCCSTLPDKCLYKGIIRITYM